MAPKAEDREEPGKRGSGAKWQEGDVISGKKAKGEGPVERDGRKQSKAEK